MLLHFIIKQSLAVIYLLQLSFLSSSSNLTGKKILWIFVKFVRDIESTATLCHREREREIGKEKRV